MAFIVSSPSPRRADRCCEDSERLRILHAVLISYRRSKALHRRPNLLGRGFPHRSQHRIGPANDRAPFVWDLDLEQVQTPVWHLLPIPVSPTGQLVLGSLKQIHHTLHGAVAVLKEPPRPTGEHCVRVPLPRSRPVGAVSYLRSNRCESCTSGCPLRVPQMH